MKIFFISLHCFILPSFLLLTSLKNSVCKKLLHDLRFKGLTKNKLKQLFYDLSCGNIVIEADTAGHTIPYTDGNLSKIETSRFLFVIMPENIMLKLCSTFY